MSKNNLRSTTTQNIFLLVSRQNGSQKHSSLQLMTRPNQAHFEFSSGRYDLIQTVDTNGISKMRDDGACAVLLSPGVYRLADGRFINSNGKAFCRYTSYEHYEKADGRPIQQLADGIPLFAMENHYDCP